MEKKLQESYKNPYSDDANEFCDEDLAELLQDNDLGLMQEDEENTAKAIYDNQQNFVDQQNNQDGVDADLNLIDTSLHMLAEDNDDILTGGANLLDNLDNDMSPDSDQEDIDEEDDLCQLTNIIGDLADEEEIKGMQNLRPRSNSEDEDEIEFQNLYSKQKDQRTEWQMEFPWDQEVDQANKVIFGNETFRENQREIINATKSHKDALALIPTGGGKSLTFQLSAVTDQGITFVIMPLLSLIEDNLTFVQELGIPACSLSAAAKSEDKKIGHLYNEIKKMEYKIVYLTPEKLVKSPPLLSTLDELYRQKKIDRFVIDEVHCVSHWGQDFRKDYLQLDQLKQRYPTIPILGLTATATLKVKDDITQRLGIQDVVCFQSSFNRPNLIYEIRDKKNLKSIESDLAIMLNTRFKKKSGIIYCISRKDCEKLSETLRMKFKIKCDYYHAELAYTKRQEIQKGWMNNEIQVIIATIAFGMGINKKDVRFVIHYSIPKSLEGYVQECGRGGRDGINAECILYYSYSDRKRSDYFIVTNTENNNNRKNENLHALYSILDYCEEPFICRRKMQLNFLGEDFNPNNCKRMCDNCRDGLKIIEKDTSREALKIIHMITDVQDERSNITMKQIVDIAKGRSVKSMSIQPSLQERYKGCLRNIKDGDIRRIILRMLKQRIVKESFIASRIKGNQVANIQVYLIPGKYAQSLLQKQVKVFISDGVRGEQCHQLQELDFMSQKMSPKIQYHEQNHHRANEIEEDDNNYGFGQLNNREEPPQQQEIGHYNQQINDLQSFAGSQNVVAESRGDFSKLPTPLQFKPSTNIKDGRIELIPPQQSQNIDQQTYKSPPSPQMVDLSQQEQQYQKINVCSALNELQTEELRQRLFLVRNRLLQQCSDQDHFKINRAFTSQTFRFFINFANDPQTNKLLGSQKILDLLKKNRQEGVIPTIEKYGLFFIEEYKHFMKVHNMAIPSQFYGEQGQVCEQLPDLNQKEHVVMNQKSQEYDPDIFSRKTRKQKNSQREDDPESLQAIIGNSEEIERAINQSIINGNQNGRISTKKRNFQQAEIINTNIIHQSKIRKINRKHDFL